MANAARDGRVESGEKEKLKFALKSTLRDALGENHPDIEPIVDAIEVFVTSLESTKEEDEAENAQRVLDAAALVGELVDRLDRNLVEAPRALAGPTEFVPALERVLRLLAGFHRVAKQLRHRHDDRETLRVNDEHDAQDLLHALLRIDFKDVRAEEWTPSYAGNSSRMDFLLKAEQLVIELKMTRPGLGNKEVTNQLAIDIERYRAHQDCKTLVCFVYDPAELITNPAALEHDLTGPRGNLIVKVVVLTR